MSHYGYKTGVRSMKTLKENKNSKAITILGLTVVGAMIGSFINLNTILEIKAGERAVC